MSLRSILAKMLLIALINLWVPVSAAMAWGPDCCISGIYQHVSTGGWTSIQCGTSTCLMLLPEGCVYTTFSYSNCQGNGIRRPLYVDFDLSSTCVGLTTMTCPMTCVTQVVNGVDHQLCYCDCEY